MILSFCGQYSGKKYKKLSDNTFTIRTGPEDGTGRTWQEFMQDIRDTRNEINVEDGVIEILTVREATAEEIASSRSAQAYLRLAQKQGFATLSGYSKAYVPGHVLKTGDKAGEYTPDKTIEQIWVAGHREGYGVFKIVFARTNEGKWKCSLRQMKEKYNLVSDTELKGWIQDAASID